MPFMQWTDMLAIDGGPIDHQHRQLVEAINDFQEAVAQGRQLEAIGHTLGFLALYAGQHFADEERMLDRVAYPKLEPHRRQHRLFIDQVEAFRAQLDAGGIGLGHGMAQFLGSWLVNHIMVSDKAYVSFLRASRSLPAMMEGE